MSIFNKLSGLVAFCSLSLVAAPAHAATLAFVYDGILLSQGQATGSFDIADDELARLNAGTSYDSRARWSTISNLVLTVSGATSGNGTFTTADFSDITFYLPAALDFGKELVGQRVDDDHVFGQPHSGTLAGDLTFNPVLKATASLNAPSAARTFTLLTDGGFDYLQLKSLKVTTAAVPEPSTWAMMVLGIAMVGGALRSRRRTTRVSLV